MAVFDPDQRRIVVRVAYDGPAHAGKTTNLVQLCRFFTPLRRGELVRLEERAGRTLFFDWLQLDGGLVGGFPLRCQLVTVPGQAVLWHRRRHLLAKADAVAFVCDSTPVGLDGARRMLADLMQSRDGEPNGMPHLAVLQANKQDLPGRLEAPALLKQLGLSSALPVVAARAHEGQGVRETLVLAIRAAANLVQRQLTERGVRALERASETVDELLGALELESSGEASAATTALTVWTRMAVEPPPVASAPAPPAPALSAPAPAPLPAAPVLVTPAPPVPALSAPEPTVSEPSAPMPPVPAPAADVSAPPREESVHPSLPTPDVPPGFVWPAAGGRTVLRGLIGLEAVLRNDLVGCHGTSDGSGTSDTYIYQAARWCLKTSRRRYHSDSDVGRVALLQLARRKLQLGPLLPPQSVLCLQGDSAGGLWLWTVSPWVTTLRAWMAQADAARDEAGLQVALEAYAQAAADALALAVRGGLVLDVHPSNFALTDGRPVYLDDDIAEGATIPAIGHALLRRVEEYEHWPAAVTGYLEALESSLAERLAAGEARLLGLEQALAETFVRTEAGREARRRLIGGLARLRPSASA